MYKLFSAIALMAISYQASIASTVTPCASGSLTSYFALGSGGCSVGDLEFSGFTSLPLEVGSTSIDSSGISVVPVGDGLEFTFNSSAASNQFFDSVYGFNVNPITASGITLDSIGLLGSSATVDGGVAGLEVSCIGAFSVSGSCSGATAGRNLAVYSLTGFSQTSDQISFAAAPLLGITMDLSADGGTAGSATLGSVSAQFLETSVATPEPGTLWLVVCAVTAVAVWRTRKQFLKL